MPEWLQEVAALTTVGLAAAWLVVRWFRIGQPRQATPGCARCEHNPIARPTGTGIGSGGIRSSRLRVID